MISTSWSIPDSPGKRGWPNISSAMTHPVDQTSAFINTRPEQLGEVWSVIRTNLGGVVRSAENQFRGTVVSRANVRDIWLVLDQNLCTSKVAQLENARLRIQQEILWLYVPVTNPLRVNICQ